MVLNMTKVREIKGYVCGVISTNGKLPVKAVVTIPDDGFARLVAYHCLPSGQWAWVHKNFRKKG